MKGTWIVKRSSIAALVTAVRPDGVEKDCIYLSPGKIEVWVERRFDLEIPEPVRNVINAHFDRMFAAPLSARDAMVKATQPVTVEVEE